jgi:DNA polymerase-4
VTVKIRFADFETYTRVRSLDRFTDVEPEIRRAAFECLSRFDLQKKVRLIGFRVSNLEKVAKEMKPL